MSVVFYPSDYQTSLEEVSAWWDFSGDPCPIIDHEWAIHRLDDVVYQNMTSVGGKAVSIDLGYIGVFQGPQSFSKHFLLAIVIIALDNGKM